MVWLAVALIVLFCQAATRRWRWFPRVSRISPSGWSRAVYDFLGGLLGAHMVKRTFWFFGSVFLFILVNN